MRQHNIEPDAHLYSIMLNGAKLCQDFGSIRRVADLAHSANVRDPIVWNDLLHSIFVSSLIEARKKNMKPPRVLPVFGPMLRLYSRFFDTKPLEPLFLGDLKHMQDANAARWMFNDKLKSFWDNFPALDANELLEPTSSTLGIMVLGFVRSLSKPYDMIAFYSHFRKLVKDGNPVALRIIQEQGTLVHDIVIKALLERQGLLRVGLDVVSDMLKDAATAAAVQQSPPLMAAEHSPEPNVTSVSPAKHPAPSVFTWSILLNGFMYHRLHHQGESILHLMRRHGISPNIVTWNTIAAGYARLQRVDRTVRALQRLESAGFEADDFTLRAFSYLKNKGRAIAQMESMMRLKRQRYEDLQARLAASPPLDELKQLESEVDEIAKMMEGQSTVDESYGMSSFRPSLATATAPSALAT
ncbi:putative pentatricopeptide repeat protein [Phaeoacremonium minimum UCRPA7]|uniref:Putative pentatricopeptide repeat protein n=1 Tax=Phaeoacremonium minimum (strain UCR-PA7) TaxID=1286976 RepID=R8BW18_PHAM7|nr:putative pentatricopeptide repeat protein [Phaeoacremonium minimum UCRPA7]EOO03515.1 putative pentatricopeptide repeat protein [Phaeoacremonium minimum UCRPA7]